MFQKHGSLVWNGDMTFINAHRNMIHGGKAFGYMKMEIRLEKKEQ